MRTGALTAATSNPEQTSKISEFYYIKKRPNQEICIHQGQVY